MRTVLAHFYLIKRAFVGKGKIIKMCEKELEKQKELFRRACKLHLDTSSKDVAEFLKELLKELRDEQCLP